MDKKLTDITDPSIIVPADDCGDLYFKLFNNMYDGLSVFELNGGKVRALYLNERYFDTIGYTKEQYRPYIDNVTVTLQEEDEHRLISSAERSIKEKTDLYCEVRGYRYDGSVGWFCIRARTADFIKSSGITFLASINDISEQKVLEYELSINRERFRILEETVSALLFEYNPFTDKMRFSVKGVKDHIIENYSMYLRKSERIHSHDVNYYFNTLCRACRKSAKGFIDLRSFYGEMGGYYPYRLYYSSIADEYGIIISVVGRVEPISEDLGISAQLADSVHAGNDCCGLEDAAKGMKEIDRRIRAGGSTGFLMVADMDGLADINEKYGSEVGDSAVKMSAELLKGIFNNSVIFRYFGDEFIVYTENITKAHFYDMFDKLNAAAETILLSDEKSKGEHIPLTFSAGLAYAKNGAEKNIKIKDYFITADKALCRAKKDGGGIMYSEKIIF